MSFFKITIKLLLNFLDWFIERYPVSVLNKIRRFLLGTSSEIIYVVEEDSWAIEWVGKYITQKVKALRHPIEITTPQIFKNKIIHFGSINCLVLKNILFSVHKSNKVVLTWFHINPTDERIKYIPIINKYVDIVHTSCKITANQLIKYGFDEKKVIIIPLGVDLLHFKEYSESTRNRLKKKYKIPNNKVIIGSFQKDGVGWGEGLVPKLIKGPDILSEVLSKINRELDIHVFLTGPARGYVINKLNENSISFSHIFLENYLDIVECYNILDLYLVTSRAEGGPQALLEGMATGIPIVTTNVGMAPDIIKNNFNGLIAEVEDTEALVQKSIQVLTNVNLKEKIIENGHEIINKFSWENTALDYLTKIYFKLNERKFKK